MTIQNERAQGGVSVVKIRGDLDMYSSNQLKEHFMKLFNKEEQRFVLDLSDSAYLDSSGIGVLVHVYTHCSKRGLQLWICGLQTQVMQVLELTKLDGFLPLAKDSDDALSRFETSGLDEDEGEVKQLRVDENSPLFDKTGMYHKEFNIDLSQIRRLANLIAQKAPPEIREVNILEQQVSEIIKNAVKHGNKNDKSKSLKLWFSFSDHHAHVIVEDEGEGFQEMEAWNEFYRHKIECYRKNDFETMMNYLQFRTDDSSMEDGGNAMFAAIEYWNEGIVYNEKRNAVAVQRSY